MFLKTLCIFILFSGSLVTQAQDIFQQKEVRNYKKNKQPENTAELASQIVEKNKTDEARVYAAYSWVVQNIKYSTDSELVINAGLDAEAKINVAFRRRKGTCENYAAIFNDLCNKIGVKSVVVFGYTKQNERVDRTAHNWCAVFLKDDWYLYDPTWDIGNAARFSYYKISPTHFIQSHIPFDPLWQFLERPVSHQAFAGKGDDLTGVYFNFADSLKNYFSMDSLHRFKSSIKRIEASGLYNSNIKTNYLYQKMNVEIIEQGKQVDLYNDGVALLNDAVNELNNFILIRNNNSITTQSTLLSHKMLNEVEVKINNSIIKINEAEKSEAQLKLGMEMFRERAEALRQKLADQQKFLAANMQLDLQK